MSGKASEVLSTLQISEALKSRISISFDDSKRKASSDRMRKQDEKFVLYLPTVNLRLEHNPAFALACHIANSFDVPLLVLAVVLDDHSMPLPHKHLQPLVMTSRRLAFLLEALSEASNLWSAHGAGVAIRVHGPKCRSPDHLTLSSRAMAVVNDEPFVNPFLTYTQRVEKACALNGVPCFRVDGSTTVPPVSILKRNNHPQNGGNNQIFYTGVPSKAWIWQKQTESRRNKQIQAAMNGEFDAQLSKKISSDHFFLDECRGKQNCEMSRIASSTFPLAWCDSNSEAPGSRPWTVFELQKLFKDGHLKEWASKWHGADSSVPPCSQTCGTSSKGLERWYSFVTERKGLVYYGRRRTDPAQPHASSRMSCYLNFGIVSIFRLVHEVKLAQAAKVSGADKFVEEIIKWREMSYTHAFSRGDYDVCVPQWATRWLEQNTRSLRSNTNFGVVALETCKTDNEKWNGMQLYLVRTGELHNNVRMTWGKQVVQWGANSNHGELCAAEEIMRMLVYLNDRYALDGLSPPSYAGLLWCIGWSEKPDAKGRISSKPASRYKVGPEALEQAETLLLRSDNASGSAKKNVQASIISSFQKQGSKRKEHAEHENSPIRKTKTLDMYFRKK